MAKVEFGRDIYKLLGCITEDGELLDYAEWDLLKELDRREKRSRRTSENTRKVREWMREHRSEVEAVKEKHFERA